MILSDPESMHPSAWILQMLLSIVMLGRLREYSMQLSYATERPGFQVTLY